MISLGSAPPRERIERAASEARHSGRLRPQGAPHGAARRRRLTSLQVILGVGDVHVQVPHRREAER